MKGGIAAAWRRWVTGAASGACSSLWLFLSCSAFWLPWAGQLSSTASFHCAISAVGPANDGVEPSEMMSQVKPFLCEL